MRARDVTPELSYERKGAGEVGQVQYMGREKLNKATTHRHAHIHKRQSSRILKSRARWLEAAEALTPVSHTTEILHMYGKRSTHPYGDKHPYGNKPQHPPPPPNGQNNSTNNIPVAYLHVAAATVVTGTSAVITTLAGKERTHHDQQDLLHTEGRDLPGSSPKR